jgi:hypothetical protein
MKGNAAIRSANVVELYLIISSKKILNFARKCFCGEFMSNETTKHPEFFLKIVRYFCPILRKFGVFRQILIKI